MQYPNQGLQLLLKDISGATLVKGSKDFEAVFSKNEASFHLKKSSAHWNDSATYFCAVSDTVTETAGGAERKPSKTLGLSVTQELNLGSFQEGLLSMKASRAGGQSSRECFHVSAVPHSETLYLMEVFWWILPGGTSPFNSPPHFHTEESTSLAVRVLKWKRQEHFYIKKKTFLSFIIDYYHWLICRCWSICRIWKYLLIILVDKLFWINSQLRQLVQHRFLINAV